jgi:hypothetical protein
MSYDGLIMYGAGEETIYTRYRRFEGYPMPARARSFLSTMLSFQSSRLYFENLKK